MTSLIPALIPDPGPGVAAPPATPAAEPTSLADIAIGGIEFTFSNTPNNPMVRETVPLEKTRIDQADNPGEQTLTDWWIKSQQSFHGGAGQTYLEQSDPSPMDKVRFDLSKNCDVSVPGRVTRLPDTTVVDGSDALQVLGVNVSGDDAIVYLKSDGTVHLVSDPLGAFTTAAFSNVSVTGIASIATDGTNVYAANATTVFKLDPTSVASATSLATYPTSAVTGPVLGWVKSRLMLGVNGTVYEVDVSTSGITLGATEEKYTHPAEGFTWRCFGVSPTAVLAAGDAGGLSTITQFNVQNVSGAPVLEVAGDIATLPVGERVLSLANSQGTFLAIGTTNGVRIGTFDTYIGSLSYGALQLRATDPVIAANSLTTRDRFVYTAGYDYDEGGLIRIDLGTPVDNGGRFAWTPDLVTPSDTNDAATSVATLPVSGKLCFSVPGTGVLVEGDGSGTGRESWLRTSKIRYDTVEPKLFKLCRVRGDLSNGSIRVDGSTPLGSTTGLATVGFTLTDPAEFRLPDGAVEWLQLSLNLLGADPTLTSWQTKALPGSRRQEHLQFVVALADRITYRTGQRSVAALSSRDRLAALEELAKSGDETELQEFTPTGVVSTRVVVERVSFVQDGRPAPRSDLGGNITILLRTVES